MRNRIVGFALAAVLGLAGVVLLVAARSGDDSADKVSETSVPAGQPAPSNQEVAAESDAPENPDGEDETEIVGVAVPPDLVRLTLELEPERAVGGLLTPGELVAIAGSFERSAGSFDRGDGLVDEGPQTAIVLEKVLVASVQVEEPAGSADDPTPPRGTLLVTLGVPPTEAAKVVFAAEYGRVWLLAEAPETPAAGGAPVRLGALLPEGTP